jgi:hypothetical protein
MLLVSLTRAAGGQVVCPVAEEKDTSAVNDPATGAVYSPPAFGRPAQLTFQNGCTLGLGDRIDVGIVCVN